MKVTSARFLVGAASPRQFPSPYLPEVAFVGKSNVGKSSLINSLLERKNLVKTSGSPGKTRQINFFLINERFCFADLPGYGFARVAKAERAAWRPLAEAYLGRRPVLRGVVMIVDARHATSPLDREMRAWLAHFGLPTVVVANKADKLGQGELARQRRLLGGDLCGGELPLAYSARTGQGRQALWALLEAWLEPTAGRSDSA